MSEEINNQMPATVYSPAAPGRIKFVGIMNIINAVLLVFLGMYGLATENKGIALGIIVAGLAQGALGYYLFKMNKVVWIINTALYGVIVAGSIYAIAEPLMHGVSFGSVSHNVIMLICFSIVEFCLVSKWREFWK